MLKYKNETIDSLISKFRLELHKFDFEHLPKLTKFL